MLKFRVLGKSTASNIQTGKVVLVLQMEKYAPAENMLSGVTKFINGILGPVNNVDRLVGA